MLAISHYSYFRLYRAGKLDIPGFIHEAKRIGADGVELLAPLYRDPEKDREAALAALAETGLPCPIFSVSNDFAKPDSEARNVELQKIRFGIEEALRYGAQTVRVFAGDVKDGVNFDEARQWIVQGLAEATKMAHDHGVRLALENHGTLAGRGDQVRALVSEVREAAGNKAIGANPDTGNFLLVEQAPLEAIAEVADLAYMVHLKDFAPVPSQEQTGHFVSLAGRRFQGAAVGEGIVPLSSCIDTLRSAGFDGWFSIEFEGEEDSQAVLPRCVRNAHRILSAR